MLGEAFLQVLKYKVEKPKHTALPKQNTCSEVIPPPETSMTLVSSRSPCTPQTLRASRHDGSNNPRMPSVPSTALAIPTCSVENHLDLEHLDSCFCPSFYQAYPDLQLAGGTVAPRYHFDPARFTPMSQGPLLNSQDLGSPEDSEGPADAMVVVDEGYLVMENQKSPGREQRLTNSMLNGFLETQLMEVYRQHMQDSLARCASASVVPEICADLSTPGTCKGGLDNVLGSSSNQSSVRYLSTCSAPPTSHFSSPVLRISYPQEPNS